MRNVKTPHITNKYGFTLIELVVVFSIMAVLATVGVASFVSYSRQQTLQQAANGFVATLNSARAKAVSQVKPAACVTAPKGLSAYRVQIILANNSYKLEAICDGFPYTITTTTLPGGVTFDSSATTISAVSFAVISGGVTGSGIIVLHETGVPNKTITVTAGGLIQ
jgi:type IV fimbrial biogenesis protein FimT